MSTHVTYRPHYCDRRYGEFTCDKIYHIKMFGMPRSLPIISTAVIGKLNASRLPSDTVYLTNGAFELYPVYYKKIKAKVVTMIKELTFWGFDRLPEYKKKYLKRLFSINTGIITDTKMMKFLIERHIKRVPVEISHPFCAQPFLENRAKTDSKRIIFIGSFESPNKGYNEMVQAFKILREKDDEWKMYMVGKRGTDFIREKVEGIHVTDFVPSLKPYLAKCSIYVHPAHFEPFGVTVLEAMSAGLIPIVTKMTGVSEVLESNRLGDLIINAPKPAEIVSKILDVFNYSSVRKKNISRRCKNIVKKRYLENEGLKDFKNKFQKLIN